MKHVLVMAKAPVAGEVKTRLCPPCSAEEAAAVAEAALADTLDAVLACGADVKILALAGRPGPWLPEGFEVIDQRGDGFAARLANAWADASRLSGGIGIQVGMDTPQVTALELDLLLDRLPSRHAPVAVLGQATDGGWWSIGLAGADPAAVFDGVPLSTGMTGPIQLRRLVDLGLRVHDAPVHRDIDTVDDLVAVASSMPPPSRTARVTAALRIGAEVG